MKHTIIFFMVFAFLNDAYGQKQNVVDEVEESYDFIKKW